MTNYHTNSIYDITSTTSSTTTTSIISSNKNGNNNSKSDIIIIFVVIITILLIIIIIMLSYYGCNKFKNSNNNNYKFDQRKVELELVRNTSPNPQPIQKKMNNNKGMDHSQFFSQNFS